MSRSGERVHVLVFPYPAQGHTLPLLDLTHQLSLRNITITVLTTPKNKPTLSPLLNANPTIQTLVFPFPSHPSIPPGVENVRELGNNGNLPVMLALANLFDPIVHWFQSHHNPPVAIISDFFLGWTLSLANQLHIPRINFCSSGAFLCSVLDYGWNHVHIIKSFDDDAVIELPDLPRSPAFKGEHLPSVFKFYKESDPDSQFLKDGMINNSLSWGCVFNSFEAVEAEYLDYFKTKMGHNRVYGVGPLSLMGPPESTSSNDYTSEWLDKCPDGSVLYVCFGSQKLLNREQMEALALGLEKSQVRFLWVVKTGSDGYGSVPEGFEERVGERGLVVKGWAPQVSILNHKAVCGFVSHCGWNSVLEAIVGGVMVLGWPMEADQFVNARLLVEDLGVAVRVCEGADLVPDSDELGKVIAESLNGCVETKVKAKELRDKALAGVRSGGGSSIADLDRLVQDLNNLQLKTLLPGATEKE
ncbi:hypothetical protein LWI28_026739 [Acer negundo]|uniref:Glycosyltransferase n=1 Tax=Acer negundo TaxID=4023 RepID=A0AAD5NMI1_ACENE|nr:hypothetical protein LWI28_026739 [Acer negundo]KAK4842722.1 hypothetical protein QYF36_026638 [Acer negundo]